MVQKIASPFGGFYVYPGDPDNLFQQLLGPKSAGQAETSSELTPAVDIYEDDKAFYASIEMPGVDREKLKLSCVEGTLTINAEAERAPREGGHWVQHERRMGTYVRSMRFRTPIEVEKISANYSNGIVELTIPKQTVEAKAVSISID